MPRPTHWPGSCPLVPGLSLRGSFLSLRGSFLSYARRRVWGTGQCRVGRCEKPQHSLIHSFAQSLSHSVAHSPKPLLTTEPALLASPAPRGHSQPPQKRSPGRPAVLAPPGGTGPAWVFASPRACASMLTSAGRAQQQVLSAVAREQSVRGPGPSGHGTRVPLDLQGLLASGSGCLTGVCS